MREETVTTHAADFASHSEARFSLSSHAFDDSEIAPHWQWRETAAGVIGRAGCRSPCLILPLQQMRRDLAQTFGLFPE